jgi:hypothetical protein
VTGLEHATRRGAALSPVFPVATVDDWFTTSSSVSAPAGDLRLIPAPRRSGLATTNRSPFSERQDPA